MRPLELRVDGFRSYRTPQTFDLRGRRLVGIVGEIGSGKSSILDAVAFALYGKTPTIASGTKALIHQLRDDCHVQLRFAVDGQIWQIQRSLRRRGQGGHKLVRLAEDEDGATELELVEGDDPTKQRVHALLGMDFDAFCRSVLLAQNRFSEFLRARPAERDAVLKGVFGFERLDAAHDAAKRRHADVLDQLDRLARDAERLGDAERNLADARDRARSAVERAEAFAQHAPTIERLRREGDEAMREIQASSQRASELDALAAAAPPESELRAAAEAAAHAGERIEHAVDAVEAADRTRSERERTLAELIERIGDPDTLSSFAELVAAHELAAEAAEEADRQLAEATKRHEGVAKAAASLGTVRASERETREAADAAHEEVERLRSTEIEALHAESAHALRSHAVVGEPCPVCDRPIERAPRKGAAPKTAAARKARAAAERAATKTRTRHEAVRRDVGTRETALASADAELRAATDARDRADAAVRARAAELTALKAQLLEHLGEGDPRAVLEQRREELAAARAALEDGRSELDAARTSLERTREEAAGAAEALAALGTRLAGCWGRLGESRDPGSDPSAITSSHKELLERIGELRDAGRRATEDATARAQTCLDELTQVASTLGIDDASAFEAARARADVERGAAEQLVHDLERTLADGADLAGRIDAARDSRDLLERLETDLRPSRFLSFLLSEERAELAELGSEHFAQLTAGAFRFSDDDRFDVRDMNAAGRPRKADSLSGGETFLASLALALALAEMVARGGGRLDAFFLDEGFGSLDPEHLDLAMEGIGRLVAEGPDRLVVLVSHVGEMRESIEDLIELAKDPITGDTRVVRGASSAIAPTA